VFRQAVGSEVPRATLARRKMGFSVPMARWLRTSLKPIFESEVLSPHMEGLLSVSEVRRLWREHQSGLRNHERKLWNLLVLASWAARYIARDPSSSDVDESCALS